MISEEFALDTWKGALKFIMEKGSDFVDQDGRVKDSFTITKEFQEIMN